MSEVIRMLLSGHQRAVAEAKLAQLKEREALLREQLERAEREFESIAMTYGSELAGSNDEIDRIRAEMARVAQDRDVVKKFLEDNDQDMVVA